MDKQQSLLLKKYIDLLYRWKLLVIVLLLAGMPVGLFVYLEQPKIYEATSLLSYQQQRINPNEMSPDVQDQIRDIVSTLSQIVTSRTNLENLIKSLGLYPKLLQSLPMGDVVNVMRKNITITPSRSGDTFNISYVGAEPLQVVKVTNALAAKFIEENLKYREERATETSSYTSNELEMAKSMMDIKEAAMRDYKLQYYNEMPDQRESNVSRLIALQEQYQDRQESILELERTRVLIQEQIGLREQVLAAEAEAARSALEAVSSTRDSNEANLAGTDVERLLRLRLQLDNLLEKYTVNHPDVKRIKRAISKLEKELPHDVGGAEGDPAEVAVPLQRDEDVLQLQTQQNDIARAIKAIEIEKKQLKAEIEKYEEWVEAAPVREAEWSALTREYGELRRHYDYLVAQDLQAKSMLNLERKQKGSQFKIEDPARLPEKPIEPSFKKIMLMTIGGALGLAGGIVVLAGFMDVSFRDPEDLENLIGIPVVSTITYFETKREKRFRIFKSVVILMVLTLLVVAVAGVFWYAWSEGKIVF